jgi:hypothetical protein
MSNEIEQNDLIGCYVRERGFGVAPYGRNKWWMAKVDHHGFLYNRSSGALVQVSGFGIEVIEVTEVLSTKTLGEVAFYRHWMEDPDGVEVDVQWLPKRAEVAMAPLEALRGEISLMGMQRAERDRMAAANVVQLAKVRKHRAMVFDGEVA